MNKKKFLVYLDILGFKKLAELMAGKFNEDVVREQFLSVPLKENIKNLEKEGVEWREGISAIEGSDNYVLLVDSDIDKLLKVVGELTTIKIFHEDYIFIPLEIAIDITEIEMIVQDPINMRKVIDFLNYDIINPYREMYREKYDEQSIIKDTFILFTGSAFAELSELHKKECIRYNYTRKNKKEFSFYYLPFSTIERERNILDFLDKINQSKSDYSGALIDKIFTPPDEFDKIKERLEKDKIVLITGTAGYGKTYTAIKLLWDWYNKGYHPEWIAGKEPKNREEVREKLANIDAILRPGHIIYFEDPFGKTEYEGRDDLKERINNIINSVKNKGDVYVIITSRKDVFEEFEKTSYSVEEVHELENELNILKPSYGYEKRKIILEKWAEEKRCEWLENEKLKEFIFDMLEFNKILPTPLSIHDFVEATVNIKNHIELSQKIEAYSRAVEKAFADEITGLYYSGRVDRVLFLSFIFVSENLDVDFIKQEYEKLKTDNFEYFVKILQEEYRTKIGESNRKKILEFSHPSYSKALSYILEHAGCNKIFCDVLRDLSQYESAMIVAEVAGAIAHNYEKLPADITELLFKLSEEDNNAGAVGNAISQNFDNLPEDIRNRLLIKLSKKERGVRSVARTVAYNFDRLPSDIKNLLLEISEMDGGPAAVANPIAYNFERLPENIRNLLLNFSENDCNDGVVAMTVANCFDRLPENMRNLLFKISEKDKGARDVVPAIVRNVDRLPENVISLLLKISENRRGASVVGYFLLFNFEKFPMDLRNDLLIKFSQKYEVIFIKIVLTNFDKVPKNIRNLIFNISEKNGVFAKTLSKNYFVLPEDVRGLLIKKLFDTKNGAKLFAKAIRSNFNKFPEDVRIKLLIELSENDRAASDVAFLILINFDEIPYDIRNKLLIELSEKPRATGNVSRVIARNFDTFPNEIKNLLFKFSGKEWNARGIAGIIEENFEKLPEEVRNELLVKLSEKEGEERYVAKAIASNFNEFPDNLKNLLDRLQEPLQKVIRDLYLKEEKGSKKEILELISNAWPKINRDFILEILNELKNDKDKKVREEAIRLLKIFSNPR